MALLPYNLQIDQDADSTSYSWTLLKPDKTPADLTSATARMMIRVLPSDPAPIVSITSSLTASGQITLGGVLGTVSLNITKAATALLVAQGPAQVMAKYLYDLFVDFPNGTSLAVVAGTVNVTLAVTH